jgi:hypothetical protein
VRTVAGESRAQPGAGRGRKVFLAAVFAAYVVFVGAVVALPDAWEAAFAVPWALVAVLVLDHLHGDGEFTRLGHDARFIFMFACLVSRQLGSGTFSTGSRAGLRRCSPWLGSSSR